MPITKIDIPEKVHTAYRLTEKIIKLSVADTWNEAKDEWSLVDIVLADKDEPGTCLCGHSPLIELCLIQNRHNDNTAIVGNVCVKKFLGLPSDRYFKALSRVTKNPAASLTAEVIGHAHRKGWLNEWERTFYLDTLPRKFLSPRQREKRVEINTRVLEQVRRR